MLVETYQHLRRVLSPRAAILNAPCVSTQTNRAAGLLPPTRLGAMRCPLERAALLTDRRATTPQARLKTRIEDRPDLFLSEGIVPCRSAPERRVERSRSGLSLRLAEYHEP